MSTENQQATQAPTPGSPEYVATMAAKYDAAQTPAAQPEAQSFAPQRPAEVPEKFWDAKTGQVNFAAWSDAYNELHAKAFPKSTAPAPEGKSADAAAQEATAKAGLDWEALGQKIAKDGTLGADDFAALAAAGIPEQVAKDYVESKAVALAAAQDRSALHVGGKEVLTKILDRASKELSDAEREFFNNALASPGWASALDTLKSRFSPADGEPTGQVLGTGIAAGVTAGFQSQYEMVNAMNKRDDRGNRLYDVDPAYRQQVRNRVALMK